jgi:hypothetical protein
MNYEARVMNHRWQLSAASGTRESRILLPLRKLPSAASADQEEAKFFRSWVVYDCAIQSEFAPRRFNWNLVLGLLLASAVSASIWTGMGLMIARLWK